MSQISGHETAIKCLVMNTLLYRTDYRSGLWVITGDRYRAMQTFQEEFGLTGIPFV